MIPKRQVEQFLNRPLNEFEWVKALSEDDLDDILDDTDPIYRFHGLNPFKHQKACFLIGINEPTFLFFLDMGLGKTRLMLDVYNFRRMADGIRPALVLVENVNQIRNWYDETNKHCPDLSCSMIVGDRKQREMALVDPADIYVCTYMGLLALVSHRVKGKGLVPQDGIIERFKEKFGCLILDESSVIKNYKSTTYKVCRKLAAGIPIRYALTGTPMGRDPHDMWSQFFFIDGGESLGPTLGLFREAFFEKKRNYWSGWWDYKFDKKKESYFNRMIKNKSIYYNEDACPDLPQKVFVRRVVPRSPQNEREYAKIAEELKNAKGDYLAVENVFLRLRQICSGYLSAKAGDESTNKVFVELPDNYKMEALLDIIDQAPASSKILIFHEYIHSGAMISAELKKKKIGHERLYSGTKDKIGAVQKFLKNKTTRILVANHKSGGKGLNLQVANYCIFYESPVSPIDRAQAEKRIHRPGQKAKRTFFYDIVCENSVEEKILQYLKEGRDLFSSIIEGRTGV